MRPRAFLCAFALDACVCLFVIYCGMLYGYFFLCCCVFARSSVVESVCAFGCELLCVVACFLFVTQCVMSYELFCV